MKVAVIDADPTQAVSRWAANAYEGPELDVQAEADETRLAYLIAAKADAADLVLVDTAGFGNRAATIAITSSDAVLIPSPAGEADVTEAEKTLRLVEALARAARREIPARVVLNRVKKTGLARHAAAELQTAGVPRLKATLGDLVAYGEMTYSGKVPSTPGAAAEITALLREWRSLGWLSARCTGAGT
jgi:chromosome partitioning protein